MKQKRVGRFLLFFLAGASLLLLLLARVARAQGSSQARLPIAPLTLSSIQPADGKLSSDLCRLLEIYRASGLEAARQYAALRGIGMREDRVRIMTQAPSASGERLQGGAALPVAAIVGRLGGEVELAHKRRAQCWVPIEGLQQLAQDPGVEIVRTPMKARLCSVSEGLGKIGAYNWQSMTAFHHGSRKTKVCILDAGFRGYTSLMGSELPSSLTLKSFRADGDIEAHEHGAACAEIVYDIAPDAEYYLVNFETDLEHEVAVDWIISQGIDVVSYSIAWFDIGDGRGNGWINEDIKRAVQSGIVWVGAAGNYAADHWEGSFSDPDGNGFHNFSDSDELFEFSTASLYAEEVFLNWDDWGSWDGSQFTPGSSQDFDLYLYYWDGSSWKYVDSSRNAQNGQAGRLPAEEVYGWYGVSSTIRWAVSIKKVSASRPVKLELFSISHSGNLEYVVGEGSLAVGPDGPEALAVGANSWEDDSYHYYSSRGPSHDGRIKPDLCAPSGVSTRTYGEREFYGTSASTPHVAGAFALLLGKTPFSREQIRQIILARAVDLGNPGPDNWFGYYGRLFLGK